MSLAPGTKLGPYEILSPLGAGGMGEVYRANDTRLGRTVAIKILPAHLSCDLVRRQRFEREAKIISGLNHPHICVLYDVGHQGGIDYLVMECVEGETLAKRLERGALPLEQVLKYGAQIAEALDKAHRSGVVHRDLKPGNIVLSATGAKLLDFGLAKPVIPLASGMTMTADTPRAAMTEEGTIVGTFQYMSPEQVEGKELDGRSDIFSLGAVLYEMVTGMRAFEGKSQLSVASSILEKEPSPITAVKPMTPRSLDHVIRKCLAKLPDDRWQSACDLASELKWIGESSTHAAAGAVARPGIANQLKEKLAWLVAGALLAILAVAAIWWWNPKPTDRTLYFHEPFPSAAQDIAIAPNGHTLALVAYLEPARKGALWVHEVGTLDAKWFGDTAGARFPFWSADGKSVGFFADGKLKKLDISSGEMQTICDAPSGRGGTWNKDGVIVFTPDASAGMGLYRVSASGGTVTPIGKLDTNRKELSHRWPTFLPDGKHYLYMAANFAGQKGVDAIFVGSLESNEQHFVTKADANAAYAAPGYLLFYRDRVLLAQRFDLKSFDVTGETKVLLTDVQYQPQVKRAIFGVSDDGLLLAQTGSGVALSQPVWFDRKGKEMGVVGEPDVYGNVALSPNGQSVAVSVTDVGNQNTDVWTYDLQHGSTKRLTFDPAQDSTPIWSPDSAKLAFSSNRQSPSNPQANNVVYTKNSDGKQEEKLIVYGGGRNNYANDWSRDGKYILFARDADLWFLTIPEAKSNFFLKAISVLRNGQFSPDGRWVAYASNETGKWEIYVTSFPDAHGKWQISIGGGEQPRWRADGKELFYLSTDGKMMSVPVMTGTTFDAGAPIALFQAAPRQPVPLYDLFVYDVSRDGQRFLINTPVKEAEKQPISVVLNWPAKLNK